MKRVALLVLAMTVLAGCSADNDLFTPQSEKVTRYQGPLEFPPPVATDGNATSPRFVPLPAWAADAATAPRSIEQMVGKAGAEPNIGVTSSGSLFVTTFDQLQRSQDQGRTWETVWDYVTPGGPTTEDMFSTADPMMWVDPITDRVYVQQMMGTQCTYVAWSDTDGDPGSFFERPLLCDMPLIDHMKIMTAPPAPCTVSVIEVGVCVPGVAVPNPIYPNVFYMCSNKLDLGMWCATSLDGGLSFAMTSRVIDTDPLCGNINGHPAAFHDGTVVVPLGGVLGGIECDRPPTVYVSEDNGRVWMQRICAPQFVQVEIDPDITTTPDGTAYMLMRDRTDQRMYLLRSKDKFQTCDVFQPSPPDHTLDIFAGITSGADGRIAMAYLGTTDEQDIGATPSNATGGTIWHAYVTTVLDAGAEVPTFVTQQVTPRQDPVQIGCVWVGGGGGGPHRCRNLLDFIDMVSDKDGRSYVAITDGCTPRNGCAGDIYAAEFQSRDAQIAVLVQDRGLGLQNDVPLPALGLVPPEPIPE